MSLIAHFFGSSRARLGTYSYTKPHKQAIMDPLTAFSFVWGIIQVVAFGTKVVKKCREVYKDGSLLETEDIEEMAKHLTDLRTGLVLPSQS